MSTPLPGSSTPSIKPKLPDSTPIKPPSEKPTPDAKSGAVKDATSGSPQKQTTEAPGKSDGPKAQDTKQIPPSPQIPPSKPVPPASPAQGSPTAGGTNTSQPGMDAKAAQGKAQLALQEKANQVQLKMTQPPGTKPASKADQTPAKQEKTGKTEPQDDAVQNDKGRASPGDAKPLSQGAPATQPPPKKIVSLNEADLATAKTLQTKLTEASTQNGGRLSNEQRNKLYLDHVETTYGKMPTSVPELAEWTKRVTNDTKGLSERGTNTDYSEPLRGLEFYTSYSLQNGTHEKVTQAAQGWMDKLKSGKITQDELVQLRKEAPSLTRFMESYPQDANKYYPLRLVSASAPGFLPEVPPDKPLTPGAKTTMIKDMTVAGSPLKELNEGMIAGFNALPDKALTILQNNGTQFLTSDDSFKGMKGWAFSGRQAMITEELKTDFDAGKSEFKSTAADEYRLTAIHESSHLLDVALYRSMRAREDAKPLTAASNMEQYLKAFGTLPSRPKEDKSDQISRTDAFQSAYTADVARLSDTRKKTLDYFAASRNGHTETFAEISTTLFGGKSRVTREDFPKTFAMMEALYQKELGWKPR
jgi:hypothetical protein